MEAQIVTAVATNHDHDPTETKSSAVVIISGIGLTRNFDHDPNEIKYSTEVHISAHFDA